MAASDAIRAVFGLPPDEAIAYFRQKGYRIGFDYRDVDREEHQASFTVAKAMQVDLLQDIRAQVDACLAEGKTLTDFIRALKPGLVERGWWGKTTMVDPETGEIKDVQLGSPRRLKTIYDTNLRTAHAEGQWQRIQDRKEFFPYLMYNHIPSKHERLEHKAWDGLVLRVDDPWWLAHMPVKAYGCKCNVIQLGDRQLEQNSIKVGEAPPEKIHVYSNKRTGETLQIPAGVDPAFNYPPGGRLSNLGAMLASKVEAAPSAVGATLMQSASPVMQQLLMQRYTAWVNAIEAGGSRGLGGRVIVGAVAPDIVSKLTQIGVSLESAALSVEQREITHLFARARKASKAVDRALVYALPEQMATPNAVLYDSTTGSEALLFVWRDGDRYNRVAVRPNFKLKGTGQTNAIRSAQRVKREDLNGPHITILSGTL